MEGMVENFAEMMAGSLGLFEPWYVARAQFNAEEMEVHIHVGVRKSAAITNAICEGINSMVQAAKRKARGFHTFEGYSSMIYLIAGKLDLAVPNPF